MRIGFVSGCCVKRCTKAIRCTAVIQAVTLRRVTMPIRTHPFQKSPNSACGADNNTIRYGRCMTPTLASMPSDSARARV